MKKSKTTPTSKKNYIFPFGNKKSSGKGSQIALLGGKGASLQEMTRIGLPVPPGFTISTEVCRYFYEHGKTFPAELSAQVRLAIRELERLTHHQFGSRTHPLLISVRSGAQASMPGMMDTILNLGINDATLLGLTEEFKNPRFALDSYRRFISMYSSIVLGIHDHEFENILDTKKTQLGIELDTQLNGQDLKEIIQEFKQSLLFHNKTFPEDPWEQLWGAITAVFNSWMNPRAVTYRKLNQIPDHWGTAVTIQAMVFGNRGPDCATGVAFTRDPSTGEKKFFGEFLINAQGEDVVAGIRTPQPINAASTQLGAQPNTITLEKYMPRVYQQLVKIYQKLESHYADMQDIEFTIEHGKLYLLQTRSGKRTASAALKIALDFVRERRITRQEAILKIQPEQLDQLLHPCLDPHAKKTIIGKGLPASPGAGTGQIVFTSETAEKWVREQGKKVILVRLETSAEDIHGMGLAEGILTARGGMTSHAAVVARGMGKCCISGCHALKIDLEQKKLQLGSHTLQEGDFITLDGSKGEIILGKVPTIVPQLDQNFNHFMEWVDRFRKLKVYANADTQQDSQIARRFGAEGIGLCRTEHMFFQEDRIDAMREMILANTSEAREEALMKILPMQKEDFKAIFLEMKDLPVVIRLLDPPLHEFIPHKLEDIQQLAERLNFDFEKLQRTVELMHEVNPMLGHRGCRLGISYPEIYKTQVRAIAEAALELMHENHIEIQPSIMIPLVGHWRELEWIKNYCDLEIQTIQRSKPWNGKIQLTYQIGTMIETPRAALTAAQIAPYASFFSFGTNDLTQTTFGLSRDDSNKFLKDYLVTKIYEEDPFTELDTEGVGRLILMSLKESKKVNPKIQIGICGEHGGNPHSIEFFHQIGLDYISCSPYRVPIAKLAAAQAALRAKR